MIRSRFPDFIIPGAMKSGTSTLRDCLSQHEDVCIPRSEIHFFDREENFSRGEEWYRNRVCDEMTDKTVIVGEKTPTYSYLPHCSRMIHEMIPRVKLVWMFRNPIDRAYSNYLHAVKRGGEVLEFDKAVEKERERTQKNIFYGYTKRSLYCEQVENFLGFFSMEQMHFIVFEEFVKNPERELQLLAPFLGISPFDGNVVVGKKNATVIPKFRKLSWMMRQLGLDKNSLGKAVLRTNTRYGKSGYREMSSRMRASLVERFRAPNQKLATIIAKDLSLWDA